MASTPSTRRQLDGVAAWSPHPTHRLRHRPRNQRNARRWGSKSGKGDDGLLGATGRDQVTSLVALYGPRTTVFVTLDDGVYEFTYGANGVEGWL